MNTTKLPQSTEAPAVGVPVERMVRPAAWALAKDGSPYMLMYERDKRSDVYSWAPLYDQAALDAAVAAERERIAKFWDGRIYGVGGMDADIGRSIRRGELVHWKLDWA